MHNPEPLPVSCVILAGGLARRFAGVDKGLIALAGRPLTAWTAGRLHAQTQEILINANRNLERYATLGHAVLPDAVPGHPGPLAGVLAAAHTVQPAWLLCVPCDVPFLPPTLVWRLYQQARAADAPLARAADETGTHFAIMLAHRDLTADLAEYVAAGGRQVQAWQARHACETVYFGDDPYAFLNINTPEDLRTAERLAPRYA